MKKIPVSHFFPFPSFPEKEAEKYYREFAEAGAEYLTVTSEMLERLIGDPGEVRKFTDALHRHGLSTRDAHALWGGAYDLNEPDSNARTASIRKHLSGLALLADLGVKTYTLHIGAIMCYDLPDSGWFGHEDTLRSVACDTLEKLLPAAEKKQITLCVENSFEPSNTPDELLYYIHKFDTPYLRCCFDSGHAHVMDAALARTQRDLASHIREKAWRNHTVFYRNALEALAPYVTTCHLHDNFGVADEHRPLFDGNTDWHAVMAGLCACPHLQSIQDEVSAEKYHFRPAETCAAFDLLLRMGPDGEMEREYVHK